MNIAILFSSLIPEQEEAIRSVHQSITPIITTFQPPMLVTVFYVYITQVIS